MREPKGLLKTLIHLLSKDSDEKTKKSYEVHDWNLNRVVSDLLISLDSLILEISCGNPSYPSFVLQFTSRREDFKTALSI